MKENTPNKFGVLTDATKEIIFEDKNFLAEIRIGCYQGKYYRGYSFQWKGSSTGCGGGSAPASINWQPFDTLQDARNDTIDYLIERFTGNPHPNGTSEKRVIEALIIAKHPQLSLF